MKTKWVSSLSKVFCDQPPQEDSICRGSMMKNERYSFQLAVQSEVCRSVRVRVESPLADAIRVYRVDAVRARTTGKDTLDDDVLRGAQPGLYPDVLSPLETCPDGAQWQLTGEWQSLWLAVKGRQPLQAGDYPVVVSLTGRDGTAVQETFSLHVVDALLPEQTLIHTEWFHADCIASLHHVPVFSEEHWALMERYMLNAVEYGINMIYLPVITPALDTAVHGERMTVQLADISLDGGTYTFGFERMIRYIEMARRCGIRYLEVAHLFSQWGAAYSPKIIVNVRGKGPVRLFGWDVAADSPEYQAFLAQYLPALKQQLRQLGVLENCWFHLSDEPCADNIQSYAQAAQMVAPYLKDCNTMDALSDYSFYEQGLVRNPIPGTDHAQTFADHGVDPLWVYFCCGQTRGVCNRFVCMPSYRSRAFGYQLFRYHVRGFLHWGFNFWYSLQSVVPIDPYGFEEPGWDTFPTGDNCIVYPGRDGPVSSLRQLVFAEALQDMRAMELLAGLTSRAEAVAFVERFTGKTIRFTEYPKSAEMLLSLREAINREIESRI